MSSDEVRVPPLISGGVMLTYGCTHACRHCLYRCSHAKDSADGWMSEVRIDETFEALAEEDSLQGMHLAGGEATMHWDRLEYATRSALRHGVSLDYLETNASWCDDEGTARRGFERLRRAGLPAVLISASLFHLEFTPLGKTNAAIDAARSVFGFGGVLVWTDDVLAVMNRHLDPSRTYTLDAACKALGLEPDRGDLWRLHGYVRPGGRAAERLQAGLRRRPSEAFEGDDCRRVLGNTTHFHIDPRGCLYTGHCPGLSIAAVDDLHPRLSPDDVPVYRRLVTGGPEQLRKELAPDFVPDGAGYVSKCHLCLAVRTHLWQCGEYRELRSDEFYMG